MRFELGAATVDPQSPDYFPDPAQALHAGAGRALLRRELPHRQAGGNLDAARNSFCAFCARLRRGMLYGAARREGYNVLALAQHLDDLAETFLMSAFYGGTPAHRCRLTTSMTTAICASSGRSSYVRERQTAALRPRRRHCR
ncbi:MAG: hypothetical protein MZV65_44045 [Chromatiales bacterium]|nr:hypothetical protein [Chromatiales bacterium]